MQRFLKNRSDQLNFLPGLSFSVFLLSTFLLATFLLATFLLTGCSKTSSDQTSSNHQQQALKSQLTDIQDPTQWGLSESDLNELIIEGALEDNTLQKASSKQDSAKKTVIRVAITNARKDGITKVKKSLYVFSLTSDQYQVIPSVITDPFTAIDSYDALIIPGGNHVDPSLYGEERNSNCRHKIDKKMDQEEIHLIRKFIKRKKPILGICRGCQLINVCLGGSLNQDIGKSHLGGVYHMTETQRGSSMRDIYGQFVNTYSFHHQSIRRLAKGLTKTMWTSDGTLEGYQHESLPIVGVQWHPDTMINKGNEDGNKVYEYLFSLIK